MSTEVKNTANTKIEKSIQKKKDRKNLATITNIVCVVLMLVFFACQFLPFWTYETIELEDKNATILGLTDEEGEVIEKTVSLADYVWRTERHDDLFGKWNRMKDFDGNKIVQNDIVAMPFIVTLLVVFGTIFSLMKPQSTWTFVFPLVSGVYATIAYLTGAIYQTGQTWQIQLVAAIAMAVSGLVLAVQWGITVWKWFTVKK